MRTGSPLTAARASCPMWWPPWRGGWPCRPICCTPFARVLESRHGFLRHFEGGIFSGDVKLAKPDPAIFELLAGRHGLVPADTLFIDDSAANVAAARQLGWQAIHCTSPAALPGQVA